MKKLTRIPSKGITGGVIAGFAEYFSVDVTLLRVLFIFFVLVTGFFPGVIGYILAAIIMPVDHPVVHEHKAQSQS
jgi:phage shock protein C